ncbi:MAG: multicopper oxidase domain-containing protein [Proteobacteria bacterium]|jgi:FtsP/CotA-like multicopper oxidase with cupredoxin domain|nr:multicopper oxidase domain-containing protein [Pseudomonadota bacterium]
MNRREFISAALCGAAATVLPFKVQSSFAQQPSAAQANEAKLLRIVQRNIEVLKRPAKVFGLVQQSGASGLALAAGEMFDITLRNEAAEATLIHWHGLTPPWDQDGVPNAPAPVLGAKADRQFRFPVGGPGTHWMHAHTLQEQNLLAAPLIVLDPAERNVDEQNVVILLHDFSFSTPEELLAGLKGGASAGTPAAMNHAGMGHAMSGMSGMSMPKGVASMPMSMDLNDIEYDAYLANDRTLDDPEVVNVESGGRVRLRIINGATATAFTIDTGRIGGSLIAVDGQNVEPVEGSRFPITMGQRLDIRLEVPHGTHAFPILALREGAREQTGIILAPRRSAVRKIDLLATANAPVVDLKIEQALRAARPLSQRAADKRFDMQLSGDMQRYVWALKTTPKLVVRKGDRVEVTMTNASMMAHPMHLHGHHFQVVAIDGKRFAGAVRDTVHIPPMRSVTVAFDAGNPGQWAFHCHHLYHMAAGMMATVSYES